MTPSLMDKAYRWLIMTWFGSGRRVGSQDNGVSLTKEGLKTFNMELLDRWTNTKGSITIVTENHRVELRSNQYKPDFDVG